MQTNKLNYFLPVGGQIYLIEIKKQAAQPSLRYFFGIKSKQ